MSRQVPATLLQRLSAGSQLAGLALPRSTMSDLQAKSKDELYAVLQNRLQQLSGSMAGLSSQVTKTTASVQQLQEVGHQFAGM